MNQPPAKNRRANGSFGPKSKLGGIAILVLLAAYSFAAPRLNDSLGWNLPQIRADSGDDVRHRPDSQRNEASQGNPGPESLRTVHDPSTPSASGGGSQRADPTRSESSRTTTTTTTPTGADQRPNGPLPESERSARRDAKNSSSEKSNQDLRYGLLREVSRDRYLSPAGLLYTPGSAEGHRLEHVRRHTHDDPGRAGSHGVFDGDMAGALKTMDRAYEKAKKGQQTTTKVDDRRTIHTVDMGGRIGFVGGREGGRKRNPMARRVRLVLEGNRVITAYPL